MPCIFCSNTFVSQDIAVNWFNWPIVQLRSWSRKIKHSLMHAPHGRVSYTVRILSISLLVFATSGLPILWSVVVVLVVVVVVDLVTISVKTSVFIHSITFFQDALIFIKIWELVNHVFKYICFRNHCIFIFL